MTAQSTRPDDRAAGRWWEAFGPRWTALVTFVVFQGAWFLVVWGAGVGTYWLGPVTVLLLVAAHVVIIGRDHRLGSLALLALVGTVVDSLMQGSRLLVFEGAWAPWLCPLWITAMWVHFGLMLLGPLDFLRGRWGLAALLGAFGGPLAYSGGVGLGAATLGQPTWLPLLALGVVWTVVCPLAVWIMSPRRIEEPGVGTDLSTLEISPRGATSR